MNVVESINSVVMPLSQVVSILAASVVAIVSLAKSSKKDKEIKTKDDKIRLLIEIPLTFDGFVYRDKNNNAYCPACKDNDVKFIHLTKHSKDLLLCPVCKIEYKSEVYLNRPYQKKVDWDPLDN